MEHGQCPKVGGEVRHGPCGHVANRIQVRASVVCDHPLRIASGATGVAHCYSIPFVLGSFELGQRQLGR